MNHGFVGPPVARLDDLQERGDQHKCRVSVIIFERRVRWKSARFFPKRGFWTIRHLTFPQRVDQISVRRF
jgi:hypothetical protein